MKRKVLLTLIILFCCVFQLAGPHGVLAAPDDPAAPGNSQPVRIIFPIIFGAYSETGQPNIEPPPVETTPPPPVTATTPAPTTPPAVTATTPPPTATTPVPAGMIDIWVFVDSDENGIYSSGDLGLSDALACLTYESDDPNCVGTDEGDTWWEDLRAGRYWGEVDPDSVPAGYVLQSIRCEETGSRAEYNGCRYDLDAWTTRIDIGSTTRLNVFYALVIESSQVEPGAYLDMWAFMDYDNNQVYSLGEEGLTGVRVCLSHNGGPFECSATEAGDTWRESAPVGHYVGYVDHTTFPSGTRLSSIRCTESGNRAVEYPTCTYDPDNWQVAFDLIADKGIDIFYALEYITPPENGYVDLWAIVDNDQNEIFSPGDIGLTGARVCLTHNGGSPVCGGTDVGDTWWEDLPIGNYEAYLDPLSMPSGMWLRSIACAETSSSQGIFAGCTNDLANWKTTFTLGPTTRINVYFGLQYTGSPNDGYVDIWAFVDHDQDGVYSSGDEGLTDVLACLDPPSGGDPSCVGTDQGDTWWEDRWPGHYQARVEPDSVPAAYQLRSIRCQKTRPYAGVFLGCSTDVANWTAGFTLGATDHINVFFALEPVD